MFRNWSNYKSSQYLWYTDKWNPEQNYKWRGIYNCCISIMTLALLLLTFRQYSTSVPFHKWRNKTFRLCSQMRIPWVSLKRRIQIEWDYSCLFLAIDLMEKMLEVDSDKRINAAQTLSHPYLEEVSFIMFSKLSSLLKENILISMQTPLTNQRHLSTTRPLKTMTLQLMFGKVSFKIFSTAFNSQFVFRKSLEHNKSI